MLLVVTPSALLDDVEGAKAVLHNISMYVKSHANGFRLDDVFGEEKISHI